MPVRKDLVRGGRTRKLQVEGDSMAIGSDGGIRDENWVLVDTNLIDPSNGRVFLLEIVGDGMTVKRLRRVNDTWLFLSDNPDAGESWCDDQLRAVDPACWTFPLGS